LALFWPLPVSPGLLLPRAERGSMRVRQGALVQSLLSAESSTKGTKKIHTNYTWSRYISTK
jgi:hypothetical protein